MIINGHLVSNCQHAQPLVGFVVLSDRIDEGAAPLCERQ
jgi:hypothetical protein